MSSGLYQRGDTWWARFKVRGVEYRRSLRTPVRSIAEKRLKAVKDSVVNEAVFGILGPIKWEVAVVSWSEHIGRSIGASTLKRYLVSLSQLRPWLDGKAIQQIDAAVIRSIVKDRQREAVTNATIRRDLTAMSSVLNHAIGEGWIETNAALAFGRQRIPERRDPITLPTDEAITLTIGPKQTRFGDLMLFARETGMRQEEIASLQHTAIDIGRCTATIMRTKGRRPRTVPLNAAALEIIARQPRALKCPFVFWHREQDDDGRQVAARYTNVASNFADYTARAEARVQRLAQKAAQDVTAFRRFRFHDLRHLFAVEYLRDRKGSIYDLKEVLGHTSVKTTEIYLDYLSPDEKRDAMYGVAQNAAHTQRSGTAE